MADNTKRGKTSLRKNLSILMILGWLVPITIICIFISSVYKDGIVAKTEANLTETLKTNTYALSTKLDAVITTSKKVSYDKNIENLWKTYKDGMISHSRLYSEVKGIINYYFISNKRFNMSCFYFTDLPEVSYYTSQLPEDYNAYQQNVYDEAMRISQLDSSDTHIMIIDTRVYIIRNLYTLSGYHKFGTLTLEVSKDYLFENSGNVDSDSYSISLFLNNGISGSSLIIDNLADSRLSAEVTDTSLLIHGTDSVASNPYDTLPKDSEDIINNLAAIYSGSDDDILTKLDEGNYQALLYESKNRDYHIGTFLIINKDILYSELSYINRILIIIWICIIPIIIFLLIFIRHNINMPMKRMIRASKGINKGEIGIQVEGDHMPNIEFEELKDAFNRVSSELKQMFEYAYKEELAMKDAKIIALQSQINPHFLNNTLEMMNWQARLSGDITVSKMIEALSTLLDQSMDRSSKLLSPLSDELRCADAYFYLISMRYGQRLSVEKEIDESLLYISVPRLILQPILENAVVHGIDTVKSGKIKLKTFHDEANIYLQVINTGKPMTAEDIKRVNDILTNQLDPEKLQNKKHVSMGIRNVNERIQLIYGTEYGLKIYPLDDAETLSVITIPYKPE